MVCTLIISLLLLTVIGEYNCCLAATSSRFSSTVAIFGGTGETGRECVYQTLKSGKKVVVLARDASKMLVRTKNITNIN